MDRQPLILSTSFVLVLHGLLSLPATATSASTEFHTACPGILPEQPEFSQDLYWVHEITDGWSYLYQTLEGGIWGEVAREGCRSTIEARWHTAYTGGSLLALSEEIVVTVNGELVPWVDLPASSVAKIEVAFAGGPPRSDRTRSDQLGFGAINTQKKIRIPAAVIQGRYWRALQLTRVLKTPDGHAIFQAKTRHEGLLSLRGRAHFESALVLRRPTGKLEVVWSAFGHAKADFPEVRAIGAHTIEILTTWKSIPLGEH